jgi:hypothetical protein
MIQPPKKPREKLGRALLFSHWHCKRIDQGGRSPWIGKSWSETIVEDATRTSSGHTVNPPERLIEEIGAIGAASATAVANYEIALTAAEIQHYVTMKELFENPGEITCVGAGLGGRFVVNTQELHLKK